MAGLLTEPPGTTEGLPDASETFGQQKAWLGQETGHNSAAGEPPTLRIGQLMDHDFANQIQLTFDGASCAAAFQGDLVVGEAFEFPLSQLSEFFTPQRTHPEFVLLCDLGGEFRSWFATDELIDSRAFVSLKCFNVAKATSAF